MSRTRLSVGLTVAGFIAASRCVSAQVPIGGISAAAAATPRDIQAAASVAIPALTADSATAATLVAQYLSQITAAKAKINELNAQIKAISDQIENLKAQIAKLENMMARLEALKEKMQDEVKDAKTSVDMMRRVVIDPTVASKLLDVMKQRNTAALGQLLGASTSPSLIVSVDILSPDQIKMVFKVGSLAQCVATKTLCGTARYSIMK